jgi:hypothetical protein
MAAVGAADGRPMVVLCFSDADPAGRQMPISIARKLQAFKALEFGDLDFRVYRVALTAEQVGEYGLPSTPLKESERRADRWRQEMGVEQTEIDALASLQPQLLTQIARSALRPFFDRTLDERVFHAEQSWLDEAQSTIDSALNADHLARIRVAAAERLARMRNEIDALNRALHIDVDDFDLPEPQVPEAVVPPQSNGSPLIDSRWSFAEQCRRLIGSKAYHRGEGA